MDAAHASRRVNRLRGAPHQKAPRFLVGLELTTGATGLVGGLLLAMRPDGSLLNADLRVLADSPFPDWRLPGLLLACLVGGGFLLAGGGEGGGRPGAGGVLVVPRLGAGGFRGCPAFLPP